MSELARKFQKATTRRRATHCRAYTLTELMLALSIFSFASAAMSSLMFASYNLNRHVQGMGDATSAAELTMRRIIEVARSATDLQYTDSTTGLLIQTPPDSSNLSYIFIYKIVSGQLHEVIETAGSLTLIQDTVVVSNINSFTVARANPGAFPQSYQINLVLNATPVPISRNVVVTCRNLGS